MKIQFDLKEPKLNYFILNFYSRRCYLDVLKYGAMKQNQNFNNAFKGLRKNQKWHRLFQAGDSIYQSKINININLFIQKKKITHKTNII